MQKYGPLLILAVILLLAGSALYTTQGNIQQISRLNNNLNNLQVQMNRVSGEEPIELTEEQQQQLREAHQRVIGARQELVDTQLQAGLITEEEAQYMRDHLELMSRYGEDYNPGLWQSPMMRGMMGMGRTS